MREGLGYQETLSLRCSRVHECIPRSSDDHRTYSRQTKTSTGSSCAMRKLVDGYRRYERYEPLSSRSWSGFRLFSPQWTEPLLSVSTLGAPPPSSPGTFHGGSRV